MTRKKKLAIILPIFFTTTTVSATVAAVLAWNFSKKEIKELEQKVEKEDSKVNEKTLEYQSTQKKYNDHKAELTSLIIERNNLEELLNYISGIDNLDKNTKELTKENSLVGSLVAEKLSKIEEYKDTNKLDLSINELSEQLKVKKQENEKKLEAVKTKFEEVKERKRIIQEEYDRMINERRILKLWYKSRINALKDYYNTLTETYNTEELNTKESIKELQAQKDSFEQELANIKESIKQNETYLANKAKEDSDLVKGVKGIINSFKEIQLKFREVDAELEKANSNTRLTLLEESVINDINIEDDNIIGQNINFINAITTLEQNVKNNFIKLINVLKNKDSVVLENNKLTTFLEQFLGSEFNVKNINFNNPPENSFLKTKKDELQTLINNIEQNKLNKTQINERIRELNEAKVAKEQAKNDFEKKSTKLTQDLNKLKEEIITNTELLTSKTQEKAELDKNINKYKEMLVKLINTSDKEFNFDNLAEAATDGIVKLLHDKYNEEKAKYDKKVLDLTTAKNELESQKSNLENQISELNKQIQQKEQEINDLKSEKTTLSENQEQNAQRISEIDQEIQRKTEEKNNLTSQRDQLSQQLTNLTQQIEEKDAKISELTEATKDLDKVNASNQQLSQDIQNLSNQISSLELQKSNKETTKSQLLEQIGNIERDITSNREQISTLDQQIQQKQEEKRSKEEEKNRLESQKSSQIEENRQLDEKIQQKQSEIDEKQREISEKENAKRALESEISGKERTINDLQNQVQTKEREISNLDTNIRDKKQEKQSKETQKQQIESQISTLSQELESVKRDKSTIEGEISTLDGEINDKTSNKDTLTREVGELDNAIGTLNNNINQLDREIATLNEQKRQNETNSSSFDQQIESKTQEKESKTQEKTRKEQEREQKRSELGTLESQIQNVTNTKNQKQQEKNQLDTDIADLERQISTLTSSKDEKERNKNQLEQDIQQLTNEISGIESNISTSNDKITRYKRLLNALIGSEDKDYQLTDEGRNVLTGIVKTLHDQINEKERQKSQLDNDINAAKGRIRDLIGDENGDPNQPAAGSKLVAIKEEITELETKLDEIIKKPSEVLFTQQETMVILKHGLQTWQGFEMSVGAYAYNAYQSNRERAVVQRTEEALNEGLKNAGLENNISAEFIQAINDNNSIPSHVKGNRVAIRSYMKITLTEDDKNQLINQGFTKLKIDYKKHFLNDKQTLEIDLHNNSTDLNVTNLGESTPAIQKVTVSMVSQHDNGNLLVHQYNLGLNLIQTWLVYKKTTGGYEIAEIVGLVVGKSHEDHNSLGVSWPLSTYINGKRNSSESSITSPMFNYNNFDGTNIAEKMSIISRGLNKDGNTNDYYIDYAPLLGLDQPLTIRNFGNFDDSNPYWRKTYVNDNLQLKTGLTFSGIYYEA